MEPEIIAKTMVFDDQCKDLPEEKSKVTSLQEICDGNETPELSRISHKITRFFPILKSNSKAKMRSVENAVDKGSSKDLIKTNEIHGQTSVPGIYGISGINYLSCEPFPNNPDHSKFKGLLPQIPNRNYSNILNTALKTSLGDILRKNIEANNHSESLKELPCGFTSLSNEHILLASKDAEDTTKGNLTQVEINCEQVTGKESDEISFMGERADASSSQETEEACIVDQNVHLMRTADHTNSVNDVQPCKSLSIQTRLKSAIRHSTKMFSSTSGLSKHTSVLVSPSTVESQPSASISESEPCIEQIKDVVAYGAADASVDYPAVESVTVAKDSVPNSVSNSSDPLTQLPNDKDKKTKKGKKRHFKGATYRLYLTPARKKKKIKKKHPTDSSKDDEMSLTSTENGSCIDSSDACSMFSDDFNTSSEKSLADDEAYSNSRCSPLLLLADQRIDLSDFKVEPAIDNVSSKNILSSSNEAVAKDVTDSRESNNVLPNSNELINESNEMIRGELYPAVTNVDVTDTCVNQYQTENTIQRSLTDLHTSEKPSDCCDNLAVLNNAASITDVRKTASEPSLLSKIKIECNEKPAKDNEHLLYTYTASNDDEGNSFISNDNSTAGPLQSPKDEVTFSDTSKTIPLSTIATSVKSRQRMKRRFTDDIVDTDIGILSLNSMPSSCRKVKVDQLPPPETQDIIENFKISLNTEARGGPPTKTESVFSSKKLPFDMCTCHGTTYEVKVGDAPTNFYCQAVDSYEEKLVGCSSPVTTFRLIRPSVRVPFTVMCEMHLWRLKQHHCCPRCGVFCSQGAFVQCKAEKNDMPVVHLFHERCRGISEEGKFDFCLHCGCDSDVKSIYLDCEMLSPPAFYQSQLSLILPSKARITFGMTDKLKEKEVTPLDPEGMHKLPESGLVISSDGLSTDDIFSLMTMITALKSQESLSTPDYPVTEMYAAASEGDVLKILYMLAKGINPNEKFSDYDGSTALHAAAASGNVVITHLLLQAGAVSDTMNRNLRTPLMIATEKNHEGVVECLVKQKAPLNTKGEVGMTCLHLAARDGHLKLCKMFIDSGGARVNAQDDGGWTPIVWASEHGHQDVVNYLIDRGGNPNIRDNEGNTALHWAAFCGTAEVCDLLLNHGCNIDEANEHGDTPVHIAARQDNFKCVDLFLSRSANLEIRNNANELPVDCCINNPTCKSHQALRLNMMLKDIFSQFHHRCEKIISKDIALGRERYPIRCVNGIDNTDLDLKEFLYVTENCETCPIKIDRCITSLQHCNCTDDCTVTSCTCSAISLKCWYDRDGHLLPEFNMLDPPLLFECNRACSCDAGICRNRVVQRGMMCRLELVRTNGRGWGVRTLRDIPKGTFICEYVGELITDSEADTRQDDSYLFDLDNKDGETYCLDARHFGNISRFINHLCEPNLVPVKVFIDHQDLSFPRIAFFSLRDIHQYEELGFDYGEKFWVIKSKSFTCNCGSEKCKYSKETIKETLENYNMRIRDELHEEINIYSV